MPEIPRDPRQLARDILAGKVRIEDLAKLRQGGGLPPVRPPVARQQQMRVPAKIPLPRQQPSRPLTVPARPAVQQRRVQPPVPAPVQPRRAPAAPAAKNPVAPLAAYALPPVAQTPELGSVGAVAGGEATGSGGDLRVAHLLREKGALLKGIVLAEVLGKPLALRDL